VLTLWSLRKGVCVQSSNIVKLEAKREPKSTWFRTSHELMKRKDLTTNAKVVYMYMLDRYTFFNSQGKEYYENMQDIGDALGIQRRTVSDCIKSLEDAALVRVFKKNVYATERSVVSHSYHVRDMYGMHD
jgi:DNA-binding MarR family transcriptional regulator